MRDDPGQPRNVSLQLNGPNRSFRLTEEITHLTIPHWGFPLKFELLAPLARLVLIQPVSDTRREVSCWTPLHSVENRESRWAFHGYGTADQFSDEGN